MDLTQARAELAELEIIRATAVRAAWFESHWPSDGHRFIEAARVVLQDRSPTTSHGTGIFALQQAGRLRLSAGDATAAGPLAEEAIDALTFVTWGGRGFPR